MSTSPAASPGAPVDRADDARLLRVWPLPEDERAVPLARHHLRELVRALGFEPDGVADAETMVTESAANAVTHAKAPYELRVRLLADAIECGVLDASDTRVRFPHPAPPLPSDVAPDAPSADVDALVAALSERGRGLHMVRALSGGRCGCRPARVGGESERGKAVWFTLPWPPRPWPATPCDGSSGP